MSEGDNGITHGHIMERVSKLEQNQAAFFLRIDHMEEAQQKNASGLESLTTKLASTHEQLIEHRSEVKGAFSGLRYTLGFIGFLITCGLVIVGILAA